MMWVSGKFTAWTSGPRLFGGCGVIDFAGSGTVHLTGGVAALIALIFIEAVEACAEDVKGQTCYICTQALHWKTKEGLVRGCSCRGTAGFAHVSCLEEQAKILVAEIEGSNLDDNVKLEKFRRWDTCSLCEQGYHGVVRCALGWACWKTYLGRPEADWARLVAINALGNGLYDAEHYEDALSVMEASLSMRRRIGASAHSILIAQTNLAIAYEAVGRLDEGILMKRDVYFGRLRLTGEEDYQTLLSANNYADSLNHLNRFEEAKSLMRKTIPIARRVLGESNDLTLKMRWACAMALYKSTGATLDDLREAVTTLEDVEPTLRRVLGGAHPTTKGVELALGEARKRIKN